MRWCNYLLDCGWNSVDAVFGEAFLRWESPILSFAVIRSDDRVEEHCLNESVVEGGRMLLLRTRGGNLRLNLDFDDDDLSRKRKVAVGGEMSSKVGVVPTALTSVVTRSESGSWKYSLPLDSAGWCLHLTAIDGATVVVRRDLVPGGLGEVLSVERMSRTDLDRRGKDRELLMWLYLCLCRDLCHRIYAGWGFWGGLWKELW
jgi:hypothetical protein